MLFLSPIDRVVEVVEVENEWFCNYLTNHGFNTDSFQRHFSIEVGSEYIDVGNDCVYATQHYIEKISADSFWDGKQEALINEWLQFAKQNGGEYINHDYIS